jgi:hypothetical protein
VPVAASIDEQARPVTFTTTPATWREAAAIHLGACVPKTGALIQPMQQLFSLCNSGNKLFGTCKGQHIVLATVLATVGLNLPQMNAFVEIWLDMEGR